MSSQTFQLRHDPSTTVLANAPTLDLQQQVPKFKQSSQVMLCAVSYTREQHLLLQFSPANLIQDRPVSDQSGQTHLYNRLDFLLNKSLVHLSQLQPTDCLEQTSAVVRAREMGVLEHLLGDLSVELG